MPPRAAPPHEPSRRDFAADFKAHLDEFVIHEYEKKMPYRLIDTYTGLIHHRSEITALLKQRSDYQEKLWEVALESLHIPDPEGSRLSMGPRLGNLEAFIREFLAFAMFSHRWRDREITIQDVRNPIHADGIYSIARAPADLTGDQAEKYMAGAKKLQEFCCTAAKCGYRWAWADTCCIDGDVFGERSESINSMFHWYRNSDLTIVYLDDLDDVEEHQRLPPMKNDYQWLCHEQIQNPFELSQGAPRIMTLYKYHQANPRRLLSMQPDTQVETVHLEKHIKSNFPSVSYRKARGKHTMFPEWLTRGWTLQETLASKRLRFYSRKWTLLEEAQDDDTEEAEALISISSFKFRARLVDHRTSFVWCKALEDTTGVSKYDLAHFEPGTRDVRTRLHWVTRRRTTKDEDMVYCMLGIFDITLPVFYGEGNRAFFRLQEEILKRTGDVSLFDWHGRCSPINSFLAYNPACFAEPNILVPHLDYGDSTTSSVHVVFDLARTIHGTIDDSGLIWSDPEEATFKLGDWVKNAMDEPPLPCHSLVNGELSISLFEHQVQCCEYVNDLTSINTHHLYRLEVDGLCPTIVKLASHLPSLVDCPTQYYLCRVWNRNAYDVFNTLTKVSKCLYQIHRDLPGLTAVSTELETQVSSSELTQKETQANMIEAMRFFKGEFPVYLIHVNDEHRVRVNTVERVVAKYARFNFSKPVVTCLVS